jgi:hypothetical protein
MRVADVIVSLLPAKLQPYAKAIAALLLGASAVAATIAGLPTWVPIVLALLNAPVVYAVENVPAESAEAEAEADEEYVPEHAA